MPSCLAATRCYRPRRVRYILLDRITLLQAPELARGVKCVSLSDDCFTDHFPGHPIMPGALIIESLAQLAGVLLEQTLRDRKVAPAGSELHALLTMIDRAKFRHVVRPGDKLELEARVLRATEDGGQADGVATVDGQRVAEAQLSFAFAKVSNPAMLAKRREFLDIWLTGSAGEP